MCIVGPVAAFVNRDFITGDACWIHEGTLRFFPGIWRRRTCRIMTELNAFSKDLHAMYLPAVQTQPPSLFAAEKASRQISEEAGTILVTACGPGVNSSFAGFAVHASASAMGSGEQSSCARWRGTARDMRPKADTSPSRPWHDLHLCFVKRWKLQLKTNKQANQKNKAHHVHARRGSFPGNKKSKTPVVADVHQA